ncbi:MAG: hypothetical protein JW788_00035 [Candidatus Omnitrophica bacterium]|nr:hypothetical protein [Candidatus Omnitrophota bacterium]
MARCPNCNNEISPLQLFLNSGWTAILCGNCEAKLLIRDKDFFIWYIPGVLFLFTAGIFILTRLNVKASILGAAVALLSAAGYLAFGWRFTKLVKVKK